MTLQIAFSSPASQVASSVANAEMRTTGETSPFEEVLKETRERKKSETDGLEMAGSAAGQIQNFMSAAMIPNDNAPTGPAEGSAVETCVSAAAPALPDAGKVAALLTGTGQPTTDLSGQNVCPADILDGQTEAAGQSSSAASPTVAGVNELAPQPAAETEPPTSPETVESPPDIQGMPEELKRAASQTYATTLEDGQTTAQETRAEPRPSTPAATPTIAQPAQSAAVDQKQSAAADPPPSQDVDAPVRPTEKTKPDSVHPTPVSSGLPDKVAIQPAVTGNDDLTRLADARSRELVQQVAQHVEMTISQGKNSLRIQLFPAEMGRIDLRVAGGPNGLVVSLVADQPATNQTLMKQFDQLRQTLVDAGIQISDLHIGGQPGYSSFQSNSREPSQSLYRGSASRKEVSLHQSEPPVLADGSGGIDYRV